jgi:hypothetical protein
VAPAAHYLVDFGVNAALRACGWRRSRLQYFGEGFETRLDRSRIETLRMRASAGGGAGPASGPVPGAALGRLLSVRKMDAKIPPRPPCPPPAWPGAAEGGRPGPIGLRPAAQIIERMAAMNIS